MMDLSRFIATEPLGNSGERGELLVWNSIKASFSDRDCLAYWRYPIFSNAGKLRKEPDILVADYLLGLIVIEVKAIKIENIVAIRGHRWEYRDFYTDYGNPYQQAENQLYALLKYCDRELLLNKQVAAKAIVALPLITKAEWQDRGFDKLPNNPPILFKDSLNSSSPILKTITKATAIRTGELLTATQWQLLLAVLGGTPLYIQPYRHTITRNNSRSEIMQQARSRLHQFDLQQEKIAKQIPPGLQRIRGVAGSGKTVILCQKAALMHIKYPRWRIALIFFSRSLYETITAGVDKWIRHFTNGDRGYDYRKSNLKILHAWGSRKQPGFYSTICKLTGIKPLSVNETELQQPNEALAEACVRLLETTAIPQIYDAILIDEAQDLIVERWKYRDKQPFYWLAYQALRPVNPIHPEQRRLIWAYDELQSLDSLNTPDAGELFGEELGHLVTGKHGDNINKTEVLTCCYRTPKQIIVAAHAIAMGLLRKTGMLTGSIYPEEWQALGYQAAGKLADGATVTLKRQATNSPNLISELWTGKLIEFDKFLSRQQELTVLADKIKYNLATDNLQRDREILVIVLGTIYDAVELQQRVARFLIRQGINIYLPTNSAANVLHTEADERLLDCFWQSGAVTISTIYRAKGQEADMVYLVGLDNIAKNDNLALRQQLFVALTRSKGWANLSGIGNYELYEELEQIINSGGKIEFTFNNPIQKTIAIGDRAELLKGFALGRNNFRNANLSQADLSELQLANINLIAANLSGANLTNTNLTGAKLIAADLSGANLTNANLSKAKLIGANLTNANLTNTNLTKANLTNTILDK